MNLRRYCKTIISYDTIEKILEDNFKDFINKFEKDLNILSRWYENSDDIDIGYELEGVEDVDDFEEVEKYYNSFKKEFEKLQEKFYKKTSAVLELGYAEDVYGLVYGHYFYIKNAYIPNPNINQELIEKLSPIAIIEDFDS